MASLGGAGGPPQVTPPSRGVTPGRIVEKQRGRTGKKVTPHLGGGDTRVKAIKSDSDSDSDEQNRSPGFQEKIEG